MTPDQLGAAGPTQDGSGPAVGSRSTAVIPNCARRESVDRGKLSPEAARFYANVYDSARKGSISDLRRRGCSPEEAEEFFSAAFEKVMESVDPVARGFLAPQMVNFIKLSARRVMFDERRRGQRSEVDLSEIQSLTDAGVEGPDEIAVEREAVAIGREALQMLSERDRLIFFQRYQMDLSPREIVQRTPGLSMRTYRKLIQRANSRVLAAIERIEGGERCEEMESSLLRRYVAGQCPEAEQLAVEVHLAHCRACQIVHARMHGYLVDVAGTLMATTSVGSNRCGILAHLPARLADVASDGANGIIEATKAGRERVRDLVLRIATGLPSAGGDATVGQLVGATSLKTLSACAAGVVAGTCVVAGVTGVGLVGHQSTPSAEALRPIYEAKSASTFVDPLPEGRSASVSAEKHKAKRVRGGGESKGNHAVSTTAASSEVVLNSPSSAKESSQVTSGEFGAESSQPVTSPPTSPTPSSRSFSGSGGGASQNQGGSSGGTGGGEFGL